MNLLTGPLEARLVSQRVAKPETSTTTIKAIPVARRNTGMMCVDLTTTRLWIFDGARSDAAGINVLVPDAGTGRWIGYATAGAGELKARGVVYNNQADLAAFVVASDDGITYAAGDRVLLVGQTTAAQNGLYVVGTVSGTAPLTRAPEMATGSSGFNGSVVEVSEGTFYAGSSWKSMATGSVVIGTTNPAFYPRTYKQQITLASGTYTIGFGSTATPDEPLYLFHATKSQVAISWVTAGGTTTSTTGYSAVGASRVAGIGPATAVLLVRANVAAGTINTADNSVLDVTVTNW